MQQDGRQDEREDGHGCQLDGGVDGRGETQSHDVATLGQCEAKESRPGNLEEIPWLDALLWHDNRSQPEQQCGTDDTERHQLRTCDAATGQHVFRERRHQPKQHHGQQHRPMRLKILIVWWATVIHGDYPLKLLHIKTLLQLFKK